MSLANELEDNGKIDAFLDAHKEIFNLKTHNWL